MFKILLPILLFFSCSLAGQVPSPYSLSGEIIDKIESDTVEPIDYLNQKAEWEHFFIGDYKRALLFIDKGSFTMDNRSY